MEYFFIKNEDARFRKFGDIFKVLNSYENKISEDADYCFSYRESVTLRKSLCLPKGNYVQLFMEECYEIMNIIDPFDYASNSSVTISSATAT